MALGDVGGKWDRIAVDPNQDSGKRKIRNHFWFDLRSFYIHRRHFEGNVKISFQTTNILMPSVGTLSAVTSPSPMNHYECLQTFHWICLWFNKVETSNLNVNEWSKKVSHRAELKERRRKNFSEMRTKKPLVEWNLRNSVARENEHFWI